jgi:CubicO group peptidase (beta-lactamase class C family)
MKKKITILFLLIGHLSHAQNSLPSKLEAYMDAQAAINNFGGTVLVTKNDEVLLKKAYGLANYEWKVNNTVDTKFELASVTKQFTAVAILKLVEQKQLALDDKLSQYFPDFPKSDSVTIHMLLCHMSGLELGTKELSATTISKESAYEAIKMMPYLFSPSSKASYSNIGYYLLAKIIEKISGVSYAAFLTKNIFEVAGLKHTGICNNDSIVLSNASNYYKTPNGYVHQSYFNWDITYGPTGIYSTVDDLQTWHKALFDGTSLLPNDLKKKMLTAYNQENYGYGLVINPFYNQGHALWAHDGGWQGAMTSFNWYPEDSVFIGVLSNNESPSYIIAYGLAGICFGKEVDLPYKHIQIELDTHIYDAYVGTYENIQILKKDKKLYYLNTEIELLPESKTKFFRSDNNDRTIEFIMDKKGKVQQLIISKAGVKEIKSRTE